MGALVVNTTGSQSNLLRLGLIVVGIGFIWVLSRSRWVNRWLSRGIDWALQHWTRLNVRDYASLLQLSQDYQVSELLIVYGRWSTVSELDFRQANLAGEVAHQDAMAEQARVVSEQTRRDVRSRWQEPH
ncbi:hypothetical protein XM38_014160 [Halomicronema hongdechloris C2206]|uniref:Uncharacterized protein n=1 Tax=Halomicronema hongdechloris C2206 TaxID=1641165 RepID=A0A1Z3HK65_9CYAN|nr:hypothetical protein [Halomicronema hongdechloris]ASC70477.1 hypothetical protein XM38_014160 [Halomicronema hongdechloris C2206]